MLREWAEKGEVANFFMLECRNTTRFATQLEVLIASQAKVIILQEHNIRGNEMEEI